MNRVSKKISTPFEQCQPDAAIVLVNALDPQINTVKAFLEAVQDIPHILVVNKVEGNSAVNLPEVGLEISCKTKKGIWTLREYLKRFPEDARIIVLGVFNSGKTSLINLLTNTNREVGSLPGTTLEFTEVPYKQGVMIDSVGQLIDVHKPLMTSIDFTDCGGMQEKIYKVFEEELEGLFNTRKSAGCDLENAITYIKMALSEGKKLIVTGAGASALVAQEIAGQGRETGVPIMCFTNNLADSQPVSFSKGIAESSGGLSAYISMAINKGDIAIGISASGGTGFVYDVLGKAREKGAKTIAITENVDTPLGHYADIIIKSDAKPEGPSSSKIQLAHLAIGHALMLVLADERGVTAEQSVGFMLPEKIANKKMGIK